MPNNETPWTSGETLRLWALWDEGHSTAEIGRRLGRSKNSVVGKAGRIGIPSRPTPIKRGITPKQKSVPKRAGKTTLPVLPPAAGVVVPVETKPTKGVPRDQKPGREKPRRQRAPPTPAPLPKPAPTLSKHPCCWPIGDPGLPSFRFCGEDSERGKPYCGAHCRVAFVRVRDLREALATG